MLKLCGFRISNYHNKVRIALLEKGIEHEEDSGARPSQSEEFLARSPLVKVPFLELDGGRRLSEGARANPLPRGARRACGAAPLRPGVLRQAAFGKRQAVRGARARQGLAGLEAPREIQPFIAGPEITLADCAAFCHLPLVSLATKAAYGRDFLEDLPQVKPYVAMLKQRPAFARVDEDRKAAQKK